VAPARTFGDEASVAAAGTIENGGSGIPMSAAPEFLAAGLGDKVDEGTAAGVSVDEGEALGCCCSGVEDGVGVSEGVGSAVGVGVGTGTAAVGVALEVADSVADAAGVSVAVIAGSGVVDAV
jgi:hypothetical protein